MHLQRTKSGSRASGGPQYYFHSIPGPIKAFLRREGACTVVLQTPYGIAKSLFMAVDRDHKLDSNNEPIPGRVGHDRIQQAAGDQSIGEAIRHWYGLKKGDFELIDVDATIHPAGHFILTPSANVGKGYDCPKSHFKFDDLPAYPCPVEVKKRSADFDYQVTRYAELPRAVVLCMRHDFVNPPADIDVLELATLARYLGS